MWQFFGFLMLSMNLALADDSAPPLGFIDSPACSYECCALDRKWLVLHSTRVRRDHSVKAPITALLYAGERVSVIKSLVITQKPGRIKALKSFSLGDDTSVVVKPGDVIYVLNETGSGAKFWFNGHIYSAGMPSSAEVEFIENAVTQWWIESKSSRSLGWSVVTPTNFGNNNACGVEQ